VKLEILLSKIIKANPDRFETLRPFGFAELQRQRKGPSSGDTNLLGGHVAPSCDSEATEDQEISLRDMLLDAERKAQEVEEQAYRKGYEQGQKDGFEVGQRSMAIVKEHLEKLLQELQGSTETILSRYRDWLIEMCLSISRRVVRRELATDTDQLIQLIDTVLREATEEHTLTVSVHPDDLDLLEKHLDLKALAERSGRAFFLKADGQLERGGCRVESDTQLFDASIEKQFSFIERAIRNDEPISEHVLG
jgi:flagellar assembly protein FliH